MSLPLALTVQVLLVLLCPLCVLVLLKTHGRPAKMANYTLVSMSSSRIRHDLVLPFAQVTPLLGHPLVPLILGIQSPPGQNGHALCIMDLLRVLSGCIFTVVVESIDPRYKVHIVCTENCKLILPLDLGFPLRETQVGRVGRSDQ